MAGWRLGFDVGGTKAVVALGDPAGEVVAERRLDDWASGSWRRDLQTLAATADALLGDGGAPAPERLGVSAPGPLDARRGVVLDAPNLPGWKDVPVAAELSARLGAPCRLENDANAAALAEWRHGAGRGTRHMAYLTMSTGVGAGLILDGRLYRGARGLAGELGHVPIVADGRACNCGLRGCLEAYTGGAALAARIRDDLLAGAETVIAELVGGDPTRASARVWVAALRAGDTYAQVLLDEFLDALAQGLAGLIIGLDPECIVLGTIVQQNPDLFLPPLRRRVAARIWEPLRDVRIEPGALGERLPAYAALCAAEGEGDDA